MSDALIAICAAGGVWATLVLWLRARRRKAAGGALLGLRPSAVNAGASRKRLLERPAAAFEKSTIGAALSAYAAGAYPGVPFSDVIAMAVCGVIGGFLLGKLVFVGGPLVVVSCLAGPVALDRVFQRVAQARSARIDTQLPDALLLQSSALRAGHSLVGSLRVLAAESPQPLSKEMTLVIREIDLGTTIESALERLSTRTASRDIELWVAAMSIHRITGGNLSSIVESLGDRIRERIHLAQEVRSLTAQGRMSGVVVAAAPLLFFVFLSATARDQMKVLFETSVGLGLLIAGLLLEVAGFLWIRSLMKVKT